MNELKYEWSDVWILSSIFLIGREKPATLHEVIAAGDFINHAIFTLSELNGGFSRLSRGGLIRIQDGTYRLTAKGKKITEIDPGAKKGPLPYMDVVRTRLNATDWAPRVDPNAMDDPARRVEHVSEEDLKKAYQAYRSAQRKPKKKKANKSGKGTM